MWQSIQINPSNYVIIERFDIILAMANTMKSCHIYYVSQDGKLYGCPEEGYALHVLEIPMEYRPSVPFVFRTDSFTKEDTEKINMLHSVVYYYDTITWAVFPCSCIGSPIAYRQVLIDNVWEVVDGRSSSPVDYFILYRPDSDKAIPIPAIFRLLDGMNAIQCLLDVPVVYSNMQNNNTVQEVSTNKVSQGRKLLKLVNPLNNKGYGLFIFRNLFNLNKGDSMDIVLRDRKDNYRLFQAEFIVRKKKNPLKDILPYYELHIFTQYIHLY